MKRITLNANKLSLAVSFLSFTTSIIAICIAVKINNQVIYNHQINGMEYVKKYDSKDDVVINEIDAENAGLILVDTAENYSIVRFSVNRFKDLDEDDDMKSDTIVPFVIAYAVSIHKSQGLEYNSVKIIIL